METKKKYENYSSPEIEIISAEVERGFCNSAVESGNEGFTQKDYNSPWGGFPFGGLN